MEKPLLESKIFVRSPVGEILEEEGIKFSDRITNYLYSKGLIDKNETRLVTPYIEIIVDIGLIEKIRVFKKKRKKFIDFAYYLNSKYSFFDLDLDENIIREA